MASRSSISLSYTRSDGKKSGYTVTIFGHPVTTIVTNDAEVVEQWINSLPNEPDYCFVGFDIEFDVNATKIGTLQFFVKGECLVLQPQKPALPPSLVQFLVGGTHKFFSLDGHSKIQLLRAEFPFEGKVDVEPMDEHTPSATNLMQRELDTIALDETDWDRLPDALSDKQVHYACVHAFLNFYIRFAKRQGANP